MVKEEEQFEGTPNYIAPEVLEKKNGHSYEVDIWSLGVVMYTMLFGRPPFETADVKLTYKRIKMNSYSFPENIKVDSTVSVRVGRTPEMIELAAQNFLNVDRKEIAKKITDLLEGNVREIVGSMKLTEMVNDKSIII